MILDESIFLKPMNMSLYYKEKGYNITKPSDVIEIFIKDLPKNSSRILKVKCDYCNNIKDLSFSKYNKNTLNQKRKYACSILCSNEKIKETNMKNRGVEYPTQSKIVIETRDINNIKKWGVKNPIILDSIQEKVRNTNMDNLGVNNPFESSSIKNKIKKTLKERYGVEHILQSKNFSNKVKKTNLEKYGTEYATQNEEVKTKTKMTNISRYGVDNPFKNELIKEKILEHKKDYLEKEEEKTYEKYKKIYDEKQFIFLNYNKKIFHVKHIICGKKFHIHRKNLYDRNTNNICICTECYPISDQQSIKEKEIINWLNDLNINFIEGIRTILEGKELDIFIPSHNLAIEFNGLYWHSEKFKDKTYHLNKSLECQYKNIQLLHIWEDEWVFKQDIIKSIILNKLNKIENKIYARHCDVRVVDDTKSIRKFLDDNHIQGYSQSSIKLGLYHQNELVSLMTFGYRHTNSKKEFELIRFCNKLNLNILGAASKLFNYFKNNYQFEDLISYSDFRLFDGKMYETLGFSKKHLSKPDYFWCKHLERKHRFNFNKQKLIKEGHDSNKTEIEIMWERGYYRIFGCGQYRWVYK